MQLGPRGDAVSRGRIPHEPPEAPSPTCPSEWECLGTASLPQCLSWPSANSCQDGPFVSGAPCCTSMSPSVKWFIADRVGQLLVLNRHASLGAHRVPSWGCRTHPRLPLGLHWSGFQEAQGLGDPQKPQSPGRMGLGQASCWHTGFGHHPASPPESGLARPHSNYSLSS